MKAKGAKAGRGGRAAAGRGTRRPVQGAKKDAPPRSERGPLSTPLPVEVPPNAAGGRPRVALVVKRSSWRVYVEERNDPRLSKLVRANDPSISRMRGSHLEHEATVAEVEDALARLGVDVTRIGRSSEPFDASPYDLVVTVGGDGTLLAASHSVLHTPVLGVNSAPSHSVGFFCGARRGEALFALSRALRGSLRQAVLTRMKVTVNGQVAAARVLNDALFCHASPAATSRYLLELGETREEQKSSGFWIGPAAGSTAAQRSAGGRVLGLASKRLQLVVREPYTPAGERYRLRHAFIAPGEKLVVRSKMHEGKMFFDGPDDVVDIGFGDVVEFTAAPESLVLVGISARRKWGEAR